MKRTLLGVAIGICIPLLAAAFFIELGAMPVATKGRPLPLERTIARIALHRAMGAEAERPCPIPADEGNLQAGARVYRTQCAVCHGLPGTEPSATAKGLFPRPPQLLRAGSMGVTDDPPGETYWKARNGIRLTGMPGYVDSLSDTELWQVSLLLNRAHDLTPAVRETLRGPVP
jgi:thiosulfate dehydrogenase